MPDTRTQARALARLLDSAFRVPGTDFRVGLDPIIGLIPGVGDLVGTGLSSYIVWLAAREGAPAAVLGRMLANIGLEIVVGVIPLLGDLFDATWKANNRNVAILEKYLDEPNRVTRSSWGFLAVILLILVGLLVLVGWSAVALLQAIF